MGESPHKSMQNKSSQPAKSLVWELRAAAGSSKPGIPAMDPARAALDGLGERQPRPRGRNGEQQTPASVPRLSGIYLGQCAKAASSKAFPPILLRAPGHARMMQSSVGMAASPRAGREGRRMGQSRRRAGGKVRFHQQPRPPKSSGEKEPPLPAGLGGHTGTVPGRERCGNVAVSSPAESRSHPLPLFSRSFWAQRCFPSATNIPPFIKPRSSHSSPQRRCL